MRRYLSLTVLAVLATALSCSDSTEPTIGPPASVTKLGGDDQQATAGSVVPDPLVVRVTDANGNPVSGIGVTWAVSAGGGSVDPGATTTNAAGEASAGWTLGTAAGENQATAAVAGLSPVTFSAQGRAGAPAALEKVGGDGQEAKTGSTLPDSLVVRVTDRYGNPVSGVTVTWQATRGGGAVNPSTRVTNAEGIAKSSWQLGDTIGAQAAAAGVSNDALRADYTATADPIDPPRAPAVRLMPGTTLGNDHFPIGNTREGGQGQTVSGIPCKIERIAYHIHPHVSLFFNGERIAIPAGVGIPNPVVQNGVVTGGTCLYWIHTHDPTGIIHVEPEIDTTLTLGQLFDIWGQPLTSDNVAGFRGPVTIYVDGIRYRGDPRAITFTDRKQIALYIGGVTPLPPIPLYVY
ncbi:MAG TPA: Ig-like domain-containing protein [Chloroflexota bacterium]|nr:Ig-like domain-containing protein [Chloroflexota bacterium]